MGINWGDKTLSPGSRAVKNFNRSESAVYASRPIRTSKISHANERRRPAAEAPPPATWRARSRTYTDVQTSCARACGL